MNVRPIREWWCHAIAGAFAILIWGPFTVMLFDRHPVLDFHGYQFTPEVGRAGQPMTITWDVTERRNCEGVLIRMIIDSTNKVHEFAPEPTAYHDAMTGPSDRRRFERSFTLPISIAPGQAIYRTHVSRWCNQVQKYLWPMHETYDAKFTIAP